MLLNVSIEHQTSSQRHCGGTAHRKKQQTPALSVSPVPGRSTSGVAGRHGLRGSTSRHKASGVTGRHICTSSVPGHHIDGVLDEQVSTIPGRRINNFSAKQRRGAARRHKITILSRHASSGRTGHIASAFIGHSGSFPGTHNSGIPSRQTIGVLELNSGSHFSKRWSATVGKASRYSPLFTESSTRFPAQNSSPLQSRGSIVESLRKAGTMALGVEGSVCQHDGSTFRALEFYSGIGGMHYALSAAFPGSAVLQAYDINEVANCVYEHNFGMSPKQGNIEKVSVKELDSWGACLWLLSPPCQPYTRRGLQKDSQDGRARSFLALLDKLSVMQHPPKYVLLENVVGFETSNTRNVLMEVLSTAGYQTEEFILTPTQYGIPYSRPRYFCLAKKGHFADPKSETIKTQPPMRRHRRQATGVATVSEFLVTAAATHAVTAANSSIIQSPIEEAANGSTVKQAEPLQVTLCDAEADTWVQDKVVDQCADVMDVVTPDCPRCCCFTKTYGQYIKGTGSILATVYPNASLDCKVEEGRVICPVDTDKSTLAELWKVLKVRFFTPREVANLHSFPASFTFPASVTLRQRYQLLGNSLSVEVVADLLAHLMHNPVGKPTE